MNPTTHYLKKKKKSLFDIIRKLKKLEKQLYIFLICWKKCFQCDRISILRDGELIATKCLELTKDKVVELMIGKAVKRGSIREREIIKMKQF